MLSHSCRQRISQLFPKLGRDRIDIGEVTRAGDSHEYLSLIWLRFGLDERRYLYRETESTIQKRKMGQNTNIVNVAVMSDNSSRVAQHSP